MPRKIKNFRDLGGIPAAGGKTVKKGLLYRSAHLCSLTPKTAMRLREETGLSTVNRKNAEAFRDRLGKHGINATIRRKLGSDINASCGQLRLRRAEKS